MRKLFKLSILSIVFALNANAYKVGDIVSSNIANKVAVIGFEIDAVEKTVSLSILYFCSSFSPSR